MKSERARRTRAIAAAGPAARKSVPAPLPPPVIGRGLAWALVAALGAVFGLHRLIDPDVFAHIAVGRALLAHPGSLGVSDFVEAYPGFHYVEDKWLACVMVAVANAIGGLDAVMVYQIVLCVVVAAAWYAMQRSWGASRAVAVVGVAIALLTCSFRIEPRPDTMSHALLAATIGLTVAPQPRRRLLWLIPLLFAFWINVHGYFVNGLLVLLAAAVAAALADRTPGVRGDSVSVTTRDRFLLLGLGVAACLLHPQGWRALASPLQQIVQLQDPIFRGAIQEFQPSTQLFAGAGPVQWSVLTVPFAVALVAAGTAVGRSAMMRQGLAMVAAVPWLIWPPPALDALAYRLIVLLLLMATVEIPVCIRERRLLGPMLLAGFTILAIPMVRNTPLITPAALIVLAPAWTALAREMHDAMPDRVPRRLALAGLVAFVIAVGWLRLSDRLSTRVRAPSRTGWGIDADRFPVGAADFLEQQQLPGPLLNNFDIGSYLLYRVHPGRRVFIAGNTSMYPPSFFQYYLARVTGPDLDLEELASQHGIRTVVLDLASPANEGLFSHLTASPRWALVFLDRAAAVYTRANGASGLDVEQRVAEIVKDDRFAPVLPTWLGGMPLTFPSANLAIFLQTIGRPDLALREADHLWPHVQSERLAALVAVAAMQTGTLAGRLPWLEETQSRYPDSETMKTMLFFGLAYRVDALLNQKATKEAAHDLERMRALRPEACGPYTALAKAAVLDGDERNARSMLVEATRRDTDGSCRRQAESDPLLARLLAGGR